MNRYTASLALLLLASCATSKESSTAPPGAGAASGGAAAQPAVGADGLPLPGLAAGARVSFDARGAFGPIKMSHVDVAPDGKVTCMRRSARDEDQRGTFALAPEELKSLEDVLGRANLAGGRAVDRAGRIMDIGTTTISVAGTTVVIDGAHTWDPSPDEVVILMSALEQRCLDGAGAAAPVPAGGTQ